MPVIKRTFVQKNIVNSTKPSNFFYSSVLVLLLLLVGVGSACAATYTANKTGIWNSASTWGGSGYPQAGDDAVINQNYTVTLTADAACTNLSFGGNAGVIALGSNNLSISGNLTFPCNAGTFTTSTGYVVLNGTSQTINLCTGGGNSIPNLRLANNTSVSMTPQTNLTVTNFDCQTGNSTFTNNTNSNNNGALVITGTCTAPNCTFTVAQNNVNPAINFSASTSNPIQVGGVIDNQSNSTIAFGSKNVTTTKPFSGTYVSNITGTGTVTVLTQTIFNTTGSGMFTVPDGVTSIKVEVWGAGGGGGGSSTSNKGGSGGGGGAYCVNTSTVTPGQAINYTVGTGGAGGNVGTGTSGGSSSVSSTGGFTTLTANGGTGGRGNSGTAGTGGSASGGSVNTSGGSGTTGGSSGGNGGNGAQGGAGGIGNTNGQGGDGNMPGGGGGGGEAATYWWGTNSYAGGSGGDGQVIITYLPAITGNTYIYQGSTTTLSNIITGGTWTSVTPAVATINSSGVVTGVSVGTSLITYTTSTGLSVTTTITVYAATATIKNASCPLVSDGTINLITPYDNAVQFNNASNNYIDLGSKLLNNLTAFTLEGWVKYKASDITGTRIGLFGQNDGIEFGIMNATNIDCYTPQTGDVYFPYTATVGDNNWHHIAAVGNLTNFSFYVDGVLKGTQTVTPTANFGGNVSNACIGQDFDPPGTTGETFPGQIRRVGMWNRALNATEIATLAASYAHVYSGSETGLIAGYNFSEGSGTALSPLPTGTAGAFVNSPTWVEMLSYSWSNGKTTRNIAGLGVGNYTVTASNTRMTGTGTFTVASDNTCATYWVGSTDNDWGKTANWSAQYVPTTGKDVIYADGTNFASVASKELVLDQNRTIGSLVNKTARRLVIPVGKGLTVNNTITVTPPAIDPQTGKPTVLTDLIYIQSSQSAPTQPSGSLIFHNTSAQPVYATVEMYSKVSAVGVNYNWQYFGIPIAAATPTTYSPTFDGAFVRRNDETVQDYYGKWLSIPNSYVLKPFVGYEITKETPTTILFSGQLVNTDSPPITLTYTYSSTAYDPGQNLLANPYTAAIDITKIGFGLNTEHTVYLYNTGSFVDWSTNNGETTYTSSTSTILAGQYLAIPQSVAGTNVIGTGFIPKDIPSMSGFLVKVIGTTSDITDNLTISYSSVMNNVNPQRAPQSKDSSDKQYMQISLKGEHSGDIMWLINEPGTTHGFDNGWDGTKLSGAVGRPQLFAMEPSGNYQISTSDDLNNTYLGFQAGVDLEDTLTFNNENLELKYDGVYLVDLVENKVVDITKSGTQYAFKAESTVAPMKRFKITTEPYVKGASDLASQLKVFNDNNAVFVDNQSNEKGELYFYDIMGRYLKKEIFGPNSISSFPIFSKSGAYVVKAETASEKVSKRIIVNYQGE